MSNLDKELAELTDQIANPVKMEILDLVDALMQRGLEPTDIATMMSVTYTIECVTTDNPEPLPGEDY